MQLLALLEIDEGNRKDSEVLLNKESSERLFGFGAILSDVRKFRIPAFLGALLILTSLTLAFISSTPEPCSYFQGYQEYRICFDSNFARVDAKFFGIIIATTTWIFFFIAITLSGIIPQEIDGFRSTYELQEAIDIPIMGVLPNLSKATRKEALEHFKSGQSFLAKEAMQNMRTSLLMSNADKPPQVLMVASSIPGEGKTTVSMALSHSLAEMDNKRVLLIEGDIRSLTFSEYLESGLRGSPPEKGLLSVLSGENTISESVLRVKDSKFDVLFGQVTGANAANVFSAKSFSELLEDARGTYDFVVVDTPPALLVADARIISQLVDFAMLVVELNRTPQLAVKEALHLFETANIKISCLAANRADAKTMNGMSTHPKISRWDVSRYIDS